MINSPLNNYACDNKSVNFQGLPKIYKKRLLVLPTKDVTRLVQSFNDNYLITGYFPKDILKCLKTKSTTPTELGKNIKLFNQAFSDQATLLRSFEATVINRVKTLDLADCTATALLQKANKKLSFGYVDYPIKYFLTIEEMNARLNNPKFTQIMKQVGAIPEDGKVSFEFVGKGTYKDCFKVRFLDKDNKDVVHAKAFVVGHNPHLGETCNNILKKRMQDYVTNTDYPQFEKEIQDKILSKSSIYDEKTQKAVSAIRDFYQNDYKNLYYYNGAGCLPEFDEINGIFAEGNAALKIRKDLGKKITQSNMIQPYIFDVKNQCGLLEFADSSLPPIKTIYNFKEHDIVRIDDRADNFINGRSIDYGCTFRNCDEHTSKYYD